MFCRLAVDTLMCTLKERSVKTREPRLMFPGMEQVRDGLSVTSKIRLLIRNVCLPCRTKSKFFESLAQFRFLGKKKLRGLSPHANYTDRAAAAGRRS